MTFTPRLKATTDEAQVRIKTVLSIDLNLSIFRLTQFFVLLLVKTDKSFFSILEGVILSVLMTIIYLSLPCPKALSY